MKLDKRAAASGESVELGVEVDDLIVVGLDLRCHPFNVVSKHGHHVFLLHILLLPFRIKHSPSPTRKRMVQAFPTLLQCRERMQP